MTQNWTYNTNMMGPMLHWYEANNIPYIIKISNNKFTDFKDVPRKVYEQWYGGRIDAHCSDINDIDYDHYGRETSLPIMDSESYGNFSDWLSKFSSVRFLEFSELKNIYENETGNILNIFPGQEYR